MRTIQVFALLALAGACFAVQLGATEEVKAKLMSFETELGSIVHNLLEVSEISETQEVSNIMKKVKTETDNEHDTLVADLAQITATYKAERKRLEGVIADLKEKIAAQKAAIKKQEDLIDRTEKAIATAEANIAQATKDIAAEMKRYKAYAAHMLQKIANQREAVSACTDALKIVADFAAKDLGAADQIKAGSSKTHAFVQMESTLKSHLNKIRANVHRHAGNNMHIQLLDAFLEMAEQGVNDQFIAKLQNLITDLREQLRNDIAAEKKEMAEEKVKHDTLIAKLNAIIKANQAIIDDLTPKLATYKKELAAMQANLASLEKSLAQTQETLRNVIAEYQRQKARYEKQIARLQLDSDALTYVLNYLAKQTYAGGEKSLQ